MRPKSSPQTLQADRPTCLHVFLCCRCFVFVVVLLVCCVSLFFCFQNQALQAYNIAVQIVLTRQLYSPKAQWPYNLTTLDWNPTSPLGDRWFRGGYQYSVYSKTLNCPLGKGLPLPKPFPMGLKPGDARVGSCSIFGVFSHLVFSIVFFQWKIIKKQPKNDQMQKCSPTSPFRSTWFSKTFSTQLSS